jgi:hypothetical protein
MVHKMLQGKYDILNSIYNELRFGNGRYSYDDTIAFMRRYKVLTPSGQIPKGVGVKKLSDVYREAKKEVKVY